MAAKIYWKTKATPHEVFDAIEREQVTDALAESCFAMTGDWDGKAWDPPAAQQPGVYAWGEAHLQYAYTLQYEATGDPRYLDTLARRFRMILALRDDKVGRVDEVRGKVMPGWGSVRFSTSPEHQGKFTSWAVHVGMILFPAARFIRLASSDPTLAKRYAKDINAFRPAIAESLEAYEDQWHERIPPKSSPAGGVGEPEGWYTEPIAGAEPLPLNQINTLGRVMLELALVAPEPRYMDRITKLARFLKNRMVVRKDNAYQWEYRPGVDKPYNRSAEDFSHASVNADFALRCYQAGLIFDRRDIERIVKTLLEVCHRGEGVFADNIDGTGDKNLYSNVVAWWGELAALDPRVADAVRAYYYGPGKRTAGPGAMVAAAMLGKHRGTPPAE